MEPFRRLEAIALPIDRQNVDTDQIVPARFLKKPRENNFGEYLFHDLRKRADGSDNPDFILNHPGYRGAQVVVAARNFACGSSREHAVWALYDHGIRAVISSAFSDIFQSNAVRNGLLPVVLPEAAVRALMAEAKGGNHVFSVDLAAQEVTAPSGHKFRFEIDPARKEKLLGGLDSIGETLRHKGDIDDYEARHAMTEPWLEPA